MNDEGMAIDIVYESDCAYCDHFYECETVDGFRCPYEGRRPPNVITKRNV